mmetsp:Transcript_40094/g.95787  ORF Transcript_40094/g.95787 Transcript_40094/m.95787 type:complete len:208 (-) Transcript_40094:85-708(-)
MGAGESVAVPSVFGGTSPVKLAATVLFHLPSASKIRGSEPLDAFHTSLVVGEVEYSFSGQGIRATRPLMSHSMLKRETDVQLMGHTSMSPHQMVSYLSPMFQPGTYDLLCKNCNSFSDCALYLMLNKRLDGKYSRMEKMGKTGQKRIGLMSALRLIGMNYQANPLSTHFQVEDVLSKIDVGQRGRARSIRPELEDRSVSNDGCCCFI